MKPEQSRQPCLFLSFECDSRFSHHLSFCPSAGKRWKHYKESCQRWLDMEDNTSWSLSVLCWSSRLRNKPLCTEGTRIKAKVWHEWEERLTLEASVTVLGTWVLSLAYTLLAVGHCSTWIQLQSLFGRLKASLSFAGFSGSPPWPFAFSAVFPFY